MDDILTIFDVMYMRASCCARYYDVVACKLESVWLGARLEKRT